ncbi:hypothetical protein [Arthrobacter psychrochitiniphilus]|uniref:hypothetical protein n=1 Tax=Arthrobacter psychrochitiniphilus TaxID=291045 RepID=UPI0035F0EF52
MNRNKFVARALAIMLAFSLASAICPSVQAAGPAQDLEPPFLVSTTVTPSAADITNGPVDIEFRARITDATGAKAPLFNLAHPSGQQLGVAYLQLESGTPTDGIWLTKVTIPEGAAPGTWTIRLGSLEDTLSNSARNGWLYPATITVTDGSGVVGGVPTITGTPAVGSQLIAIPGMWEPTDVELSYQWSADGEELTDATDATLVLGPEMAGKAILVTVTGTKAGYTTAAKSSTATSPIVAPVIDTSAPSLGEYSVTPTKHNLANGPAEITIRTHITDVTGAKAPTVNISHASGQSHGFGSMTLVEGTAQDGTWERKVTIPVGSAPGAWEVSLYPLSDTRGNSGSGFKTLNTITIEAPVVDTSAPSLGEYSVTPTKHNLANGPAEITIRTHITDVTGAKAPTVNISHASGQSHGFGSMTLVEGTAQDGTWERKVTIPVGSAPGAWEVSLYPLSDTRGNRGSGFKTLNTITLTHEVPLDDLGTAIPEITGTPIVGNTLTAVPGAWGPAGVELSYQWSADGTKIDGATKATLVLGPNLAGSAITVTVTGSKIGYTTSSKASTQTAKVAVANVSVVPGGPTSVAATGHYTVPSTVGVTYRVNGTIKTAGSYASGYTKVGITAEVKPGYMLSGTTSWTLDLSKKSATATAPAVNYTTKTITIPHITGVAYSIDGAVKAAGTHRVTTHATVTATAAAANYVVAAKTWKYDLRTTVVPVKPVFNASANTVKIPANIGVIYYVNNVVKKAGTHTFTGTGTVTARAASGSYKLAGATSWNFDNRNAVVPVKPVFNASANTVKIPANTGVIYYVNNVVKKAGTHTFTGTGTVTARAA